METLYRKLFHIDVLHGFYTDGKCSDFTIFPISGCEQKLRNHQSVFRYTGNTCSIFFRKSSTSSGPIAALAQGTVLSFGMSLQNPFLFNYTDDLPPRDKVMLFTNVNTSGGLTSTVQSDGRIKLNVLEARMSGPIINHVIDTNNGVTLVLRDAIGAGTVVTAKQHSAGSKGKEVAFDLTQYPAGLYILTEDDGSPRKFYYYVDAELNGRPLVGLIRIVTPNFTYDENELTDKGKRPPYKVAFTARNGTWKYYIVSRKMSAADMISQLRVVDNGFSASDDPHPQIVFNNPANLAAADQLKNVLAAGESAVLVTSQAVVSWRQRARKKIELRKNGQAIIESLPNPDTGRPEPVMLIYV